MNLEDITHATIKISVTILMLCISISVISILPSLIIQAYKSENKSCNKKQLEIRNVNEKTK